MAFVKSGWLHRQSTILRRWKRNWFDLWSDGRLVFYDDQQRRDMEDEIHMKVDCINIRNASACRDLMPPEGKSKDSLLQIVCRDGRVISICADSADDALAWTMALQDARLNTIVQHPQVGFAEDIVASAPPPYSELNPTPQVFCPDGYGGYVPHPPPYATQMVYSADGQQYAVAYPYLYQGGYTPGVNHVIVQERRRDDTGDVALGMLAGAATGLALGSLFSVF
ncbi:pleckstrin homology domain-containing family B member 2-like isoform X2 [Sinocyclocheilus rhinocerous]|uniref:pleckstrin homology domain-containing family B member 2-like isoform X1 n=1 Tax=Sinocyclocheilus rhinocerous TaxID=307959 RepID=UPI0007B98533|nr:PREDICTED: pleckstrin homology domain-containing family B member 2-like isoform X1 [Sinocyclocheilus rhinocerous]XP_016376664.1 PREDICTED: pleckstrin homology domain-containing family B member 2-like isoform X2 [Sinocyclocheilus rhinocerous]XP_016376665.1 PREDICTED: pleckstrin homology domain-containing family B member 2-like isoform X2 [Sinocyclocheilus rhinocerous]XP_016376666.1 PREDICTED: pleckstrin homology domain-containing family B member 2-like isoform X2 [Sinocyclocheilus rhinocerous]